MPIRLAAALAAAAILGLAPPASAQLGSDQNVPRQKLYNFAPQKRLDTGLGTNAETRAPSATAQRNGRRAVTRHHSAGN